MTKSVAAQPASTAKEQQAAEPKDTVREVAETVVFVVVLVLLLKMFTAEAFVIPTGSMATTLWGYQKVVVCPSCGHQFPVNCSKEVEERTPPIHGCDCPNCQYTINFEQENLYPSPNTGDRVLVVKFLYDLFPNTLNRFDVVVFKFPEGPQKSYAPVNYIKRLVGLPGETIGTHNGDLYVATGLDYGSDVEGTIKSIAAGQDEFVLTDRQGSDWNFRVRPNAKFVFGTKANSMRIGDQVTVSHEDVNRIHWAHEVTDLPLRRQMHRDRHKDLLGSSERFKILRKTPDKMLALRRLVHDYNHPGRNQIQRWAEEKEGKDEVAPTSEDSYSRNRRRAEKAPAWLADPDHGFRHPARIGPEIAWLRYRHLLHGSAKAVRITDFMGYNSGFRVQGASKVYQTPQESNWVGDLILECQATVANTEGELVLELSKGPDRFQATFRLATGECSLVRRTHLRDGSGKEETKTEELAKKPTALKKPGTYRIRFANVDERLTVWLNDELPFGEGITYQGSGKSHESNDLEPASIGVREGGVSVHDLKLWRDTYYTNDQSSIRTLYVQPGHYLCLGDNSSQSSDGRSWGERLPIDDLNKDKWGGLVPERLLLGRALAVYYPFKFPYWPMDNPINRMGRIK